MKYSDKEKKEIFSKIEENGYVCLKNFYTKAQLDGVKKSLFDMLNYIKHDDKITDLHEKYYQIKKFNPILKGHFYDLCPHEIEFRQLVHHPAIIDIVKGFFRTNVVFSGAPNIHMRDSENERIFSGHQETHMFSKDNIFVWAPLFDAKDDQGGLIIYEGSHKHGYWKHNTNNKLKSTSIDSNQLKQFKEKKLEVNAGDALLIHSRLVHASAKTFKKNFVRFVITDRICPLKQIPYLEKEKVPIKIPYPGHGEGGDTVDYNTKDIYL